MMFVVMLMFIACAPRNTNDPPATDSAQDQTERDQNLDETLSDPEGSSIEPPASDHPPVKAIYDGTDPEQIITILCAQPMCHAGDDILGYKTTEKGAQLRVNTHSSIEVDLTKEQQMALTIYFTE
jgi:hypothetical protein